MTSSYQRLNDPSERQQFGIEDPEIQHLQERDQQIKYRVRKLRVFIRTLGFACSAVVVSLMIANLVVFYKTEQTVIKGVSLWPQSNKLWPTYVTLGVAVLSLILAIATLLAYFWGTKYANRWNIARTTLTFVSIGFIVVLWGIAAFGLQSTSSFDGVGSRSLWSSTCDATDNQREIFGHVIDFHRFCLMQSWAFICAGIEIGVEVLTVICYIFVFVRMRHKKHLRRVMSSTDYRGNPPAYNGAVPIYVEPPSPIPSPYVDNKPHERQVSQPYSD